VEVAKGAKGAKGATIMTPIKEAKKEHKKRLVKFRVIRSKKQGRKSSH